MPAQRSLLLMIFILFFFEPGMANWLSYDAAHWYRPFLTWLAVGAAVYLAQRGSGKNEL